MSLTRTRIRILHLSATTQLHQCALFVKPCGLEPKMANASCSLEFPSCMSLCDLLWYLVLLLSLILQYHMVHALTDCINEAWRMTACAEITHMSVWMVVNLDMSTLYSFSKIHRQGTTWWEKMALVQPGANNMETMKLAQCSVLCFNPPLTPPQGSPGAKSWWVVDSQKTTLARHSTKPFSFALTFVCVTHGLGSLLLVFIKNQENYNQKNKNSSWKKASAFVSLHSLWCANLSPSHQARNFKESCSRSFYLKSGGNACNKVPNSSQLWLQMNYPIG